MLSGVHRRLTRLAKTAEDFRDVVGAVWAPKVGAYVCAAHFLEHHLRETAAGLVLDAVQARPAIALKTSHGIRTRCVCCNLMSDHVPLSQES